MVVEVLINVLVFGSGYRRHADRRCSATTLRRRRDEWISAGVMDRLECAARQGYDRLIGLELSDVAVDGCLTKAPCGCEVSGPNPADRGKLRFVHLDAGYDSGVTRILLAERGLQGAIAHKGLPAPVQATKRWSVERTHAWHNNFYKLARCSERIQIVADFTSPLANTIVLVRRLVHRAWIL